MLRRPILLIALIALWASPARASTSGEPPPAGIATPPVMTTPQGPADCLAAADDYAPPSEPHPWALKHTLMVAGAASWLAPYVPLLAVGASSAFSHPSAPERVLAIPLWGPWGYLVRGGGSGQPTNQALLGLNGAVQLAGAAALSVGVLTLLSDLAHGPSTSALSSTPSPVGLRLVPAVGPTQAGALLQLEL
jgi:hypothetical protein